MGAHEPFPQIPNNGGPTLHHLQVFTLTFDGYPHRTDVERFGDWVVTSDWLNTVGVDYDVHAGMHVAKIHLPGPAPSTISDTQVQQFLASKLNDGTLLAPGQTIPGGTATITEPLYMIYYPSNVTITLDAGGGQPYQSCQEFGGYHMYFNYTPVDAAHGVAGKVAYAVLPTCAAQPGYTELSQVTSAASHELIEAASDPFPWLGSGPDTSSYALEDYSIPWTLMSGENADLCVGHDVVDASGFTVTRVWSNAAAASSPGASPCIPTSPEAFLSVSTDLTASQGAGAGQTVTYHVHAWSDRSIGGRWYVGVAPYQQSFQPQYHLFTPDGQSITEQDASPYVQMGNGDTATLTVTVPAGTAAGNYTLLQLISILSQTSDYSVWPVAVFVQ